MTALRENYALKKASDAPNKRPLEDLNHFFNLSSNWLTNGALDRSRTCNRWNRNPILYPIELRVHRSHRLNDFNSRINGSTYLIDPLSLRDWPVLALLAFSTRWGCAWFFLATLYHKVCRERKIEVRSGL